MGITIRNCGVAETGFHRLWHLPERQRLPGRFCTPDTLFDVVRILAVGECGADGGSDGTGTSGRSADVGEGGWRGCGAAGGTRCG